MGIFGNKMPQEIFDVNGLRSVGPKVRELARRTSESNNPVMMLSVGSTAYNVEEVLDMASQCECGLEIRLAVHDRVRERVLRALSHNDKFVVKEEVVVKHGNLPSFMVSDVGYYVQEGLSFDQAVFSVKNERIRAYLKSVFDEIVEDVPAV